MRETLGRATLVEGAEGEDEDEDEDEEEEAGDMGGAAVAARWRAFDCSAGEDAVPGAGGWVVRAGV